MPLLDEIDRFIKTHDLTERKFGEMALNDKNLVSDMRNAGRSPSLNTAARIHEFMITYPNHKPFEPRARKAAA